MKTEFKSSFILIVLIMVSLPAMINQAFGQTQVVVGGYDFPPFVEFKNNTFSGLTLDMIEAINKYQTQYKLVFYPTSSRRRYKDFMNHRFDMIMFENINWEWQDKPVAASKVFLKGGEVYITKAEAGRDQSYFKTFAGKTMCGFLGYHYGFANFNADPAFLEKNFSMVLTTNHNQNIKAVLLGRVDIGVITKSFLKQYLYHNPRARNKLLISTKLDQVYQHTILIRKGIDPSVEQIDQLLDNLTKNGVLSRLWHKYGIDSK